MKQSTQLAGPPDVQTLIRRYEDDLAIARRIQAAMIPQRLPDIDGIEMASLYLPCDAIGGDLYDMVQISEDLLAFFIFDVAGHGIPSALISAMAKVSFSNHIRQVHSPRVVVERVNLEMIQNVSTNYFLTTFVAFLDLHNNKLTYCNAGHTSPLLYHSKDNLLVSLQSSGTFLGVFPQNVYEEKSVFLNPGDWLLLFTDGLYGIFNAENELVGNALLEKEFVKVVKKKSATTVIESFRKRYDEALLHYPQEDDISCVAIEILTQSRKNQIKEKLGFAADAPVYLQTICYFEEMDKVTAVILSSMDAFGYSDDLIRKMKITLTELLANAIYHGNQKDHTKKVTIGHLIDNKQVSVAIMDEGEGFVPANVPDPTLPENLIKGRGRGLYIVRNYVDAMEHNNKGNLVKISKLHGIQ